MKYFNILASALLICGTCAIHSQYYEIDDDPYYPDYPDYPGRRIEEGAAIAGTTGAVIGGAAGGLGGAVLGGVSGSIIGAAAGESAERHHARRQYYPDYPDIPEQEAVYSTEQAQQQYPEQSNMNQTRSHTRHIHSNRNRLERVNINHSN